MPPSSNDILGKLNQRYLKPKAAEEIKKEYLSRTPFCYAVLSQFLDDTLLKLVLTELEDEEWYPKNNDLYTFFQSDGLGRTTKPNLQTVRDILYSPEFRTFLQAILGIELYEKVDASASRYWNHCHLLCHDDEYQGRRVAFILYLVPDDWSQEDGGMLDLFKVEENGQPTEIAESILPCWNQLVFFEVTPVSFHQVSEVLSSSKQRLAISGWFCGESVRPSPQYEEPPLPRLPLLRCDESPNEYLKDWICPPYLLSKWQKKIARRFEKNSSIQLENLLVKSKHARLQAALDCTTNSNSLNWNFIGPANRRHYETLGRWEQPQHVEKTVEEAILLFQSPQFAYLLQKLTGLALTHVHLEVKRFKHGCYTLSQDNVEQYKEAGLDVYYFLCKEDCWDVDVGGQISYMDETDELVTFVPADNAICMAFRDAGCMRFVKYINSEAPGERHEFSMTFWEDDQC